MKNLPIASTRSTTRTKTAGAFRAVVAVALMVGSLASQAADGLVSGKSTRSAKETMDRFEAAAKQRGLNVFVRVDHAAGAASVGKTLRPTEVLIFGNPRGGTPLLECAQTVGIDLPLKALVWEDAAGQVWLGYNDTTYVAKRHEAPDCPAAANVGKVLADISAQALGQ